MSNSVILASSSPRRLELLRSAGIDFKVIVPNIDETRLKDEHSKKMVSRLAHLKALTIAEGLKVTNSGSSIFVIAADTTVMNDQGQDLGKPANLRAAKKMLQSLQGRTHQVFTAYCILKLGQNKRIQTIRRTIKTRVTFRALSNLDLDFYLSRYEVLDKAGAYGAQDGGMFLISELKGSFSNVMGLPLTHVLEDLKRLGIKSGR